MTLKMKSKRKQGLRRLNEYFQQTTLHGWVYVAEEKGLLKLFWLMAMAGFVTLAFYFLAKNINEYKEVFMLHFIFHIVCF